MGVFLGSQNAKCQVLASFSFGGGGGGGDDNAQE